MTVTPRVLPPSTSAPPALAPEEPGADVHGRLYPLETGPYRQGCRVRSSSPARSNARQEADTHQQ